MRRLLLTLFFAPLLLPVSAMAQDSAAGLGQRANSETNLWTGSRDHAPSDFDVAWPDDLRESDRDGRFDAAAFPEFDASPQPCPSAPSIQDEAHDNDANEDGADENSEEPEPEGRRRFHVGIDIAWHRVETRFVSPETYAVAGCDCELDDQSYGRLRGSASIGLGGFAVEASLARALSTPGAGLEWSAGLRLDTGFDAPISIAVRAAYLNRGGEVGGRGGRASVALQVRLKRPLVLYGEAGGDVTDVPASPDAALAYSYFFGAGVRFVLAR